MTESLRIGVVGVPGQWSSEWLADVMAERTGFRLLLDLGRVVFDGERGSVYEGDLDLSTLDGLVVKKIGATYNPTMLDRVELLRHVAESGVTVRSRPESLLRVLDRLSGTITLQRAGIPIPPTVVTEDVECAAAAVERFGQAVLKPLYSSKARGMRLLEAGRREDLVQQMREFKKVMGPVLYVQQRVEHPGRDLGVAFLCGQYLGTYARVSGDGAWNTTIRSGGRYAPHTPPTAIIDLAHRAQALFDLDFTTVDVVETPGGPMVFEVSAFGGFRGLQNCLGLDIAGLVSDAMVERVREGRQLRVVGGNHA